MSAKTRSSGLFAPGLWKPFDLLLLAIPLSVAIRCVPAWHNPTLLFVISGIAILPLAAWMGRATDELSEKVGQGVGGLLHATLGNAPELIITLVALSHGLVNVVKASITGAIIGNILLVLGSAIIAGGMRRPHLLFNRTSASVSATSLCLAAMALIIPTVFHVTSQLQAHRWSPAVEQKLSIAIAIVLLVTYVLWLVFSLVTHKELTAESEAGHDEANEDSRPAWPAWISVTVLAVIAVLFAVVSELFADSVEATCSTLGLTEAFVGVIVVAAIGNSGEFSTAVAMARKNKMDLSLGVTIGSSLQIALFVAPLLVFASQMFGHPMNLEFSLPEIVSIILAVGVVSMICIDGECNWLEGVQLIAVYLIVAILFFFLPAPAG